jgi:hypothetical protein
MYIHRIRRYTRSRLVNADTVPGNARTVSNLTEDQFEQLVVIEHHSLYRQRTRETALLNQIRMAVNVNCYERGVWFFRTEAVSRVPCPSAIPEWVA